MDDITVKEHIVQVEDVNVYVIDNAGETLLMRELSGSSLQDFQEDAWFDEYDHYSMTVTNYKHLPKLISINYSQHNGFNALFQYETGRTLADEGRITRNQTEQLIDALNHLHKKGIVHGMIIPENIWVTQKGMLILYGAGEWKALNKKGRSTEKDINQLIKILIDFGDLSAGVKQFLNENPSLSLHELERYVLKGDTPEPSKGGLQEKAVKGGLEERDIAEPKQQREPYKKKETYDPVEREEEKTYGDEYEDVIYEETANEGWDRLFDRSDAVFAGFWRRFMATSIDFIVLVIPLSIIFGDGAFSIILFFGWVYFAWMESSRYQGTLGKVLLNLRVTDRNGYSLTFKRSVIRYYIKLAMLAFFFIGFLLAGITKRKEGLHDLIVKTYVISERRV